jgi:hypothetical protein
LNSKLVLYKALHKVVNAWSTYFIDKLWLCSLAKLWILI